MNVLEYAQDMGKSVEEIISKCKKIGINVNTEEDMLSEDAIIDLDTSDHGLPKAHPNGAHKHIFDYSKKKPRGNPQAFTAEELEKYKDIIRKGENYHDESGID